MGDRQFYIDDDTGRGHFVEDWPDNADRDCDKCNTTMSLDDGMEWPEEGPVYCWGCAHDVIAELSEAIDNPNDINRLNHFQNQLASEIVERHNDMGELTRCGQVKKGDTLEVVNDGMKELHEVDQVIDSGTDGEEIILDSKLNLYFITSMYLNASSWAKSVRVVFTA